jgi:hypothetical protein
VQRATCSNQAMRLGYGMRLLFGKIFSGLGQMGRYGLHMAVIDIFGNGGV